MDRCFHMLPVTLVIMSECVRSLMRQMNVNGFIGSDFLSTDEHGNIPLLVLELAKG